MLTRVVHVHPLRPLCLEQALAGKWLLARHGHASTIVIGAKGPQFEAHAWLEVGDEGPSLLPLTSAAGYQPIWRV